MGKKAAEAPPADAAAPPDDKADKKKKSKAAKEAAADPAAAEAPDDKKKGKKSKAAAEADPAAPPEDKKEKKKKKDKKDKEKEDGAKDAYSPATPNPLLEKDKDGVNLMTKDILTEKKVTILAPVAAASDSAYIPPPEEKVCAFICAGICVLFYFIPILMAIVVWAAFKLRVMNI